MGTINVNKYLLFVITVAISLSMFVIIFTGVWP